MRIGSQKPHKKAKKMFTLTHEQIGSCGPTFGEVHATPLYIYIPAVWNSLPEDIANPELSLEHFKTGLKTHLFRLAYA